MFRGRSAFVFVGLVILTMTVLSSCVERPDLCDFCHVPIPERTRTVVQTEQGDLQSVCDPRCALTHQEQTGAALALLHVTDFETGAPLTPSEAFYVTGSDVTPDAHTATLRNSPQDVAERHWHRCLPSVLAFGTRGAATQFQRRHGGEIVPLEALGFAPAER